MNILYFQKRQSIFVQQFPLSKHACTLLRRAGVFLCTKSDCRRNFLYEKQAFARTLSYERKLYTNAMILCIISEKDVEKCRKRRKAMWTWLMKKNDCLNGVYRELAAMIGMEVVMKIYSAYHGQQITFPVNLFSKDFIKTQILTEYNGHNVRQLATKFGYSERSVRRMLKQKEDG